MNNIVAGLESPGPMKVDLICKTARFVILVSIYFMVFHTNLMDVSARPLLWWLYDNDMSCSMFNFWQNVLNLPKIKLVPDSDINLHDSLYSANKILQHLKV